MKKILSLCLCFMMVLCLSSVEVKALSDLGDTDSSDVTVTLDIPTNPEITVSIPASINITYDEGKGMYYGEDVVSAYGNALKYTRLRVQNRTKENKVITLETDDGKTITGNLIFGDYEGKEVWSADELKQGFTTPGNPVTKKVSIEISAKNGYRKGNYTANVSFDVELEPDIYKTVGKRIQYKEYQTPESYTFDTSFTFDNTGSTTSKWVVNGNYIYGSNDVLAVTTNQWYNMHDFTDSDLKGCKFNDEEFLKWTKVPDAGSTEINGSASSVYWSERFRSVPLDFTGGNTASMCMYFDKKTVLDASACKSYFSTFKIYYHGTLTDFIKHYRNTQLGLDCDIEAYKNYVAANDKIPGLWDKSTSAEWNYGTLEWYCLDDNLDYMRVTPEVVNALP